ncbi:hypothetical protein ACHRVZ_06265 [Flavobacterium sp. FlaQc-57]|uniref:hypothetical protein n=1 Tax=Flavobacterium sp. FlaQc-57 TaxID=3374186 RepID=UPI0037567B4F
MRKFASIFLLVLGFITSCSSDSDNGTRLNSSIVIDGVSFVPTKGVYYNQTASFDSQKRVRFLVTNEKKSENLYIDLSFPSAQTNLTGIYSLGPGSANELLGFCELVTPNTRYYIGGHSIKVTDFGSNNFKFEFVGSQVLDVVKNYQVNFKGGLEGKFELQVK